MQKKILIFISIFNLVFTIPLIHSKHCFVYPQTKDQCDELLNSARNELRIGNFIEAIGLIDKCLEHASISITEQEKANKLKEKVLNAMKLESEAINAVKELLLAVPNGSFKSEIEIPQLKEIIKNLSPTLIPAITKITPTNAEQEGKTFLLTVIGANFAFGSEIFFNGIPLHTTYKSSTELTCIISSNELLNEGEFEVKVLSPISGGKISNIEKFKVLSPPGSPWAWISAGGGALVAGAVTAILIGGSVKPKPKIADPPSRP